MELKVIKAFNGKVEGRILNPGETVVTDDLNRINTMVGRGLCVITSVGNDTEASAKEVEKVSFQGEEFDLNVVKEALATIGTPVNKNAGVKGVTNAIEKLTEEQTIALSKTLKEEE